MSEQLEESDDLDATSLEKEIGLLSLEQALRDFEIANARVVDLTQRLIAANDRVVALQREADQSRVELTELRALHNAMRSSTAFRLADKIWTLRNLLRV
jgi:exonuclease VII small subunit